MSDSGVKVKAFTVHKELTSFLVRHDNGAGTIIPVALINVTEPVPLELARRIANDIAWTMNAAHAWARENSEDIR